MLSHHGPGRDRRKDAPPAVPELAQRIEGLDLEIQDEIERLSKTSMRDLPVSGAMRNFYRTYRWEKRYRSIRIWLFAVAGLNLLCALADPFIVGPSHIIPMIEARTLISLMFFLSSLPLYRQRGTGMEAICAILPCVFLLFATGIEGLSEGPIMLERYVVNACFVIASGVVLLRIEPRYMSILVVLACTILSAFILVSPIHPAISKIEIIGFYVSALIALLNAHRAQTLHRYRSVILGIHTEIQARKMGELNEVLVSIARTDPLTGIANRRHFDDTISNLVPDAPITVLMIDIDHFKALNDTFGHAEGDRCLRLVARAVRDEVRISDLAARFGGEEFAVLLQNCDPGRSAFVAERIRSAVSMLDLRKDGSAITVSIGIAQGMAGDIEAMIQAADAALYQAKKRGRDRVVAAPDTTVCA